MTKSVDFGGGYDDRESIAKAKMEIINNFSKKIKAVPKPQKLIFKSLSKSKPTKIQPQHNITMKSINKRLIKY